ncbi:T-cell surface glycoprotein CD3 delta chain isoform X1 [Molossus molossus]|uniref:T-cell surface glycoprotein CD3 delta chain isoform X1 n=1 Tax=Molossus molossus TaxID=27622 RepID=UPI001746B96C|nr:T-cell surface glycoprotein CD3 delta chain isoform X1 [Molossus molossus]
MERGRFLAGLMLAALLAHGSPVQILVEEPEDKVILSCNVSVTRLWGTEGEPLLNNKNLDLGKRVLDPRGQYTCGFFNESITNSMQIYYRSRCLPSLWVGVHGASGCENFPPVGAVVDPSVLSTNQAQSYRGLSQVSGLRTGESLADGEEAGGALRAKQLGLCWENGLAFALSDFLQS